MVDKQSCGPDQAGGQIFAVSRPVYIVPILPDSLSVLCDYWGFYNLIILIPLICTSYLRRCIAILFLSLQLLTNTELCQLLKLPVLIEHFREHGELYKDLSFTRFIRLHYFNGDERDADYDRDMQLPFKTGTGALLISNAHLVTVPFYVVLPSVPVTEHEPEFNKFDSPWTPPAHHNDIFQPPRFS